MNCPFCLCSMEMIDDDDEHVSDEQMKRYLMADWDEIFILIYKCPECEYEVAVYDG